MTILFAGGEDSDFEKATTSGGVVTTNTFRRTDHSRCALSVTGADSLSEGWFTNLASAQTEFWVTGRFYVTDTNGSTTGSAIGRPAIGFYDGTTRKFFFGASTNSLTLLSSAAYRFYDGAVTPGIIQSSGMLWATNQLIKIDVYIKLHASAGVFRAYVNGTLVNEFLGNTAQYATQITRLQFGRPIQRNTGIGYWSEVIAADVDTREFGLVTLAPAANGNTMQWTGSVTDINEVTLSDATLITGLADQIAQFTVSPGTVLVNGDSVVDLIINARGLKAGSGPQNIQGTVRVNGTDYFTSTKALPAAFDRISFSFAQNPDSSSAWLGAPILDVAFNLGVKSIA